MWDTENQVILDEKMQSNFFAFNNYRFTIFHCLSGVLIRTHDTGVDIRSH